MPDGHFERHVPGVHDERKLLELEQCTPRQAQKKHTHRRHWRDTTWVHRRRKENVHEDM